MPSACAVTSRKFKWSAWLFASSLRTRKGVCNMNPRTGLCFLIVLAISIPLSAETAPHLQVVVIAPSVSTSMEARSAILKLGWIETKNYRTADGIFVVVRSALLNPLSYTYSSICDLQRDADLQLNIAGPNFHLYFYSIEDDLSSRQIKHTSYEAR